MKTFLFRDGNDFDRTPRARSPHGPVFIAARELESHADAETIPPDRHIPFMLNALQGVDDVSERGSERYAEAPLTRRSFELIPTHPIDPLITLEYPFHQSAREALAIVSLLCFGLIVTAPLGFWLLFRAFTGVVRVSQTGVVAKGVFGSTSFRFDEISRIGLLEVPVVARGIRGAIAKRRAGGDRAVYLVVKTRSGKTRKFVVSSYDEYIEILGEISLRTRKPYAKIAVGRFGTDWPPAA